MNEKPIRKMNREELLEMLIQYTEINEQLELRMKKLEAQLAEAEKKLEDREIAISRAGSIAEASLQLCGVFEAAQRAADQYLENVRRMYPMQKSENVHVDGQDGPQELPRRRKRGMGL